MQWGVAGVGLLAVCDVLTRSTGQRSMATQRAEKREGEKGVRHAHGGGCS